MRSTCALWTALAWLGHGPSAGRWWADEGHAGNSASDTGAALAGAEEGCKDVSVSVDDTLVQAGVTNGAAVIRRDRVRALNGTRFPLTVHHLILIRKKKQKQLFKLRTSFLFTKRCWTDQAGALRAGIRL